MSHRKKKQNIESLSIPEEKSLRRSTRLKVSDEAFQSQKLRVNKKLSSDKTSSEKSEYLSQTSKENTVSESLSDKRVDADMKRQTVINNNLPVEEKLGQYEFEIDENEQVAERKKKKRNVKRKNKNESGENYHPGGHVVEHILKVGCDLTEKDIKERPRRVNVKENMESVGELAEKNLRKRGKRVIHDRNVKLKHQSSEEIQAELLNEDVPIQLTSGTRGVQTATPSESSLIGEGNCVATNDHPEEIKIHKKVEVQGLEDECTELQFSVTNRKSTCDLKTFDETPCPELDDTLILEDPSEFDGSFEVSVPRRSSTPLLTNSLPFASGEPEIESIPNFLLTSGSNDSHELDTSPPLLLMECNFLATPGFNQSEGRDETVNLDSSTIFSAEHPSLLSHEVMDLSGDSGDDVQDNNKLTKDEIPDTELDDTLILEDPNEFEGSFEISEPRRPATPIERDSLKFDPWRPQTESIPNFSLSSESNDSDELATLQPTAEIRLSTPTQQKASNELRLLMAFMSLATPGSEGRDKTVTLDSSSTILSAKPPSFLSQEVIDSSGESGDDVQDNNKLTEERNVENNFGFVDTSEETEVLPPMLDAPLKQRLRKTTLASSTPLQKSRNKLEHSSLFLKRKPLTPAISQLPRELPKSNFKIKDKAAHTPQPDKLKICTSAKLSSFSNAPKQRKLDFTPNSSKSSTDETSKHKNGDTPLLFEDAEDNTPTHFKEPPRRSYGGRSVKRKMKPLGDESEEEEKKEQKAPRLNARRSERGRRKLRNE